ncbi:MarR family transcriptional regulator [Kosakonia radicincitans DSM 16656]|uniref:DNA-binding transcriptional regulator, MarR family n=1 Tax=Kosakonia radicincitans TaxID=283686 RepID=A0AAX2EX17_9ENTR|nr:MULTISPECIES: MarR family transcriptional regulator [Kosakonia]MDP9568662.1 DNA-binding MarR family transcriptional regulator [Kosakonia oryzae]APG19042.1 MarR family transcriptional regulator [Kosakonia radicincitans]ARD59824.1 MarR family transcriptional regulator [Kosakonia radicincitans DSM 16656]KDE34529.1 MarR family transcriptional regulator [Kosakonia radicincitans UMEnt01/12]MDD7995051.1 MarR family transcriptional regulator [Kosakonia radicincitans]
MTSENKPLPSAFEGPDESPGYLLWRVSNSWQREQRNALQHLGLTHTQFVVLAVASWFEEKEALTQIRLSQLTGSDTMTISQVVRVLEKADYLERIPHQKDTRSKVIRVTKAGRELAEQAVQVVEATDKKFFMPLEDNGQSLVTLFRKLLR